MMNRAMVGLAAVALLATGCSINDAPTDVAEQSATPTATMVACTPENAVAGQQSIIHSSAFEPACVRAVAGQQFFLVNGDVRRHILVTQDGAPEAINATLANKNSTYAPRLPAGRYDITCSLHGEKMTVFVEAPSEPESPANDPASEESAPEA